MAQHHGVFPLKSGNAAVLTPGGAGQDTAVRGGDDTGLNAMDDIKHRIPLEIHWISILTPTREEFCQVLLPGAVKWILNSALMDSSGTASINNQKLKSAGWQWPLLLYLLSNSIFLIPPIQSNPEQPTPISLNVSTATIPAGCWARDGFREAKPRLGPGTGSVSPLPVVQH